MLRGHRTHVSTSTCQRYVSNCFRENNTTLLPSQHNPFVMTHELRHFVSRLVNFQYHTNTFSLIDLMFQLTLLTPPKPESDGKTVVRLETQKSSPELGPAPLPLLALPPLPELLLPPPSPDGEAPLPLAGFTGPLAVWRPLTYKKPQTASSKNMKRCKGDMPELSWSVSLVSRSLMVCWLDKPSITF